MTLTLEKTRVLPSSGPVLQAALVPIGFPGLIRSDGFHLNMYTSPALLSILIYLALGFLYVRKFHEYVVLDNETQDIASITQGTFSVNNLCKRVVQRRFKTCISILFRSLCSQLLLGLAQETSTAGLRCHRAGPHPLLHQLLHFQLLRDVSFRPKSVWRGV